MAAIVPFDRRESWRRRDNSERARANRKLLAEWRRRVEEAIRGRALIATDGRVADALMNFPSSTTSGYLWAAQATVADNLNASASTIWRSVSRLKHAGLLAVRKRGTGRSGICVFCLNGEPLIAAAKSSSVNSSNSSPVHSQTASNYARVTTESYKSYESIERESGQRPSPPPGFVAGPQRRPKKPAARQAAQNNIVSRLGNGDIKRGWLLFGALEDLDQKTLEEFEHDGVGIDDALLAEYRRRAMERLSGGAQP